MSVPERLRGLVGTEHDLDTLSWELRRTAYDLRAPVIGAYQISCSDESERECIESFHHIFVRELLPQLKYWSRSSFRTATLGARYEPGAIAIAEDHFTTPESVDAFKLLVVKINSHVSVVDTDEGQLFGWMQRYERESVYCGAIHALLDGGSLPFIQDMTEMFRTGGMDRLAALHALDDNTRCLAAAITNVRLQAARIVADIETVTHRSPTLYLIVAGVTLNRTQKDTELVCGMYAADYRQDPPAVEYVGLGDDPSRYQFAYSLGRLSATES